ncbi:MAG: hypothetical protein LBG12_10110, partial [Synergistaceae bacterium]|nr:hypothetical protein [Synergistaceae bacterium]
MPEMMESEQIAERNNRKTEPVLRIAENPTRKRSGDVARNDDMAGGPSGIDVLRQAAQEGLTVHIGDDEYYVRSINKYFANLYPTADIDALPGKIDGRTMDWDALKKDPYSLASEIRSNELRVTDYFLDINDFRDAVVGNTRNAAVIERMGLTVPDRNDPLIPVLQSDGSPYYTVGDKVYIDEEQPVEILAIGNGHVWYSRRDDDSGTVLLDFQRYFESKFFENQLNNDAIERAREIERSGEKQLISSVNLPELTRRLNEERKDMKAWEAAHPGKTVQEWLHEISKEIKCESYGPLGQPPKGTDLWRINLKGCDESLFYDFVDQKFMYGKTSDVYRTKEAEHKRYLERLETLAERLNDRLTDFKKSDAPNMRHYVTDLLAEANREIRGDCVSISTDGERGIYVRYVDKHDNPYIPTILYDGNEGKFLAGSLHDLERKQMDKYEHLQNEKK